MQRFSDFSRLNRSGQPAPSSTVTVRLAGTATIASLYNSNSTADPKANPFTAGTDGLAQFYAANGRFDIEFSGGGIVTPWSLGDTLLYDPADASGTALTFNVKNYGALGDGTTDDTIACQAAITAAEAAGGGRVYFPTGIYRLTDALTATLGPLEFAGDGIGFSSLVWDDNATKGLTVIGSSAFVSQALAVNAAIGDRSITLGASAGLVNGGWAYLDDTQTHGGTFLTKIKLIAGAVVTLEDALPCNLLIASTATLYSYTALQPGVSVHDLEFATVTRGTTASKLTLLQIQRCDAAVVRDCVFDGAAAPLVTPVTCYHLSIERCHFRNALTTAGGGIEVQASTGTAILNCTSTLCQFGFVTAASPFTRMEGNRVDGRATSVALGRGIKLQDQSNFSVVSGNTVTDPNLFGVYLQDSAHCVVADNVIGWSGDFVTLTGQHGVALGGFEGTFSRYNTVSGNQIRGASGNGIFVNPTGVGLDMFATLSGNTISGCLQRPIYLGSSRNLVTGNTLSGPDSTFVFIQVAAGCGKNTLVGNTCINEGAATTVAISTSPGTGANVVASNYVGANTYDLHATDLVGATTADITSTRPKTPVMIGTPVGTDANTAEKTLWSIVIPANTLTSNNLNGIRIEAYIGVVINGGVLRIRINGTIMLATVSGNILSSGAVHLMLYALRNGNTALSGGVTLFSPNAAVGILASTGYGAVVDFTAPITILITGQNTAAVANDLQLTHGIFEYIGVPTSAYT